MRQHLHDRDLGPERRQTLANSTPITPPPRITTDDGTRSSVSA